MIDRTSHENHRNDDINLEEILVVLWHGKWILLSAIIVAMSLCVLIVSSFEKRYQTYIELYSGITLDLFEKDTPIKKIEAYFFNERFFEDWKSKSENIELTYSEISKSFYNDGFLYRKKQEHLLVLFEDNRVIINTNDQNTLMEISNYLGFLNKIITKEYYRSAQEALVYFDAKQDSLLMNPENTISIILSVKDNLLRLEKGEMILIVSNVSVPKQVTPRLVLLTAIVGIITLAIAMIYLIVANARQKP